MDYKSDLDCQSIESLRSILERGPTVVYRCQEYWDYGVDYISPNVTELLGWSPQQFIEAPLFRQENIHPDDLQKVLSQIPSLFETGRQIHEYRLKKKDGSYLWVMDDVRALQKEDGEFEGLVGYITDITGLKQTERSLRESELRHRTIFETVLEGIITIDQNGIIQDFNNAAETIFGYGAIEVIGNNVSCLMPNPDSIQHDGYLEHFHKTGEKRIIGMGREVKGLRKNGEQFEMSLAVSPLTLPNGKYFVGCVRDISKQVQAIDALRISQERLKFSQELANIGTWDWHVDSEELFWSGEVSKLLGYEPQGPVTNYLRFIEAVHPDDLEQLLEAIRGCVKDGSSFNVEHRVIWPDGTVRWLSECGDTIRNEDGGAVRMLGIVQDVTDMKARETELRDARHTADEANKAKSEFLSRMSHELRTPLNAILGFAQLLGLSRKHPLVERQEEQVNQIVNAGKHLLHLINEVLDLSRIEAGHLNLIIEDVHMDTVLEECLSLVEILSREKQVTVTCDPSLETLVCVDRMRLKQVLLNLLSNAVKYNKIGGTVHLGIEEREDHYMRFSVIDNGEGIAPEKTAFIFEPFNRLGAETSDVEGTGIGLNLTKQLVEAMNGKIGFESERDKGTTFWVEFSTVGSDEYLKNPINVNGTKEKFSAYETTEGN